MTLLLLTAFAAEEEVVSPLWPKTGSVNHHFVRVPPGCVKRARTKSFFFIVKPLISWFIRLYLPVFVRFRPQNHFGGREQKMKGFGEDILKFLLHSQVHIQTQKKTKQKDELIKRERHSVAQVLRGEGRVGGSNGANETHETLDWPRPRDTQRTTHRLSDPAVGGNCLQPYRAQLFISPRRVVLAW